ncbi:RapZ C-terminal domain-containing protein [Streptomyces chartreusis]|uniref:RapZ C-terminal domain-containing protein n=1 Tax=Streptomyces chartreusis TaxID=1969 RepID=UPI003801D160
MTTISITSYGTGHNDNPIASDPVAVDTTSLHNPPDDPAVRAHLTQKSGLDIEVARYVMATPGADHLIETAMQQIRDRLAEGRHQIDVHVSCFGGRHRSVTVALELAFRLRVLHAFDGEVHVAHRHITRPILPSRNA